MSRKPKRPLRGSVTQNFAERGFRPSAANNSSSVGPLLRFACLLLATGLVIGGLLWVWHNKWPQKVAEEIHSSSLALTTKADFAVRDVIVEGRRHTDKNDLTKALDVITGAPMLSFEPEAALKRIESLPWVAHAVVIRRLPDTILVSLTEREPSARWQHNGKTVIIDHDGKELPQVRIEDFENLPLLIGEDAPREAQTLLDALKAYPDLQSVILSAIRVSERRWNLYLKPKMLVKLPEKNLGGALQRLKQLVSEQKILERDVVAVDLRLPDRLYLESGAKPKDSKDQPKDQAKE